MTQAINTSRFYTFEHDVPLTFSPNDGTPYYSGNCAWTTNAGIGRATPHRAGRIKTAMVNFSVGATLGTTETSTLYVRLNNTTDYTLTSAVALNARFYIAKATGLDIPVNGTTDYIELKWITPTWTTNPTAVSCRVVFEIAY